MNNRLFKNTIAVIVTVIMVFSFSMLSFAKEKVDLTKYFTPQKLEELEKVYTVEELEKMLEVELENDKKIHENAKSRILIHLENIDSKTLKSNDELKKYLSQNNPDLLGYIKDIEIFSTDPEDGDSVPEVYKEAFIGIRLNEEGQKKIDDVVEKLREVKGVVMADRDGLVELYDHKGDADGDGKVTSKDARLVLRYSANLEKFDERQISVSDVNFDKKVNAIDARIILRVSARLETLPN